METLKKKNLNNAIMSFLCEQVYLREQRVSQSFTWTAVLLPLWWRIDGSAGQSERSWGWWVSSMCTMLVFLLTQKFLKQFLCCPPIRVSGDPLSKLPLPHKLAVLATMDEVSAGFLKVIKNVFKQATNAVIYQLERNLKANYKPVFQWSQWPPAAFTAFSWALSWFFLTTFPKP